jgi:hypothetical protein
MICGLPGRTARDDWLGLLQEFLEDRIRDAPDEICETLARNLWQLTAELDDD